MDTFTGEPWFGWSIALIIVLPLLVIVLSEVHLRLSRSGNALAGPVNRVRVYLLPLTALLILLTQAANLKDDNNGVRVVATLVGVIAVATALNGLNAALFGNATEGTWRERLPSIFIDLARLILIVTGAAIVGSLVWGLNVGGLFAALGVGSIVIGLALQTAIGSVVSGLLLLFEQPFRIGDVLDVEGVQGKVVEMNWRATHIDIGSGIQVIPNATIAAASFANLSRPTIAHDLVVETSFEPSNPPHVVTATLMDVASSLPFLRRDAKPSIQVLGGGTYATTLPLPTAGDADRARTVFLDWLWYASRRDEVGLDGVTFAQRPREEVVAALQSIATTLDLEAEEIEVLASECEIETYGLGERIEWEGRVPERFAFIVSGSVKVVASSIDGAWLTVGTLDRGEFVGGSALLHEPAPASSEAATVVDVLQVPLSVIERVVAARPSVARRLTDHTTRRRNEIRDAFVDVNESAAVVSQIVPALRP